MNLEYETEHLILKALKPTSESAGQVLDFYIRNRDLFERFEASRPANFYTTDYQEAILSCEYNLAQKLKSLRFWVFEKENPSYIIGTICFYDITHSIYDCCKTGYKFDKEYQHKGYAREAMHFGIYLMFEKLNLHRIEAYVMEDNTPSIRLLLDLGFECEGICRKSIRVCGVWEDHMLFSLIK